MKVEIFSDRYTEYASADELEDKVNKWLSNNEGKILVKNISYGHATSDSQSIMSTSIAIWYEELELPPVLDTRVK